MATKDSTILRDSISPKIEKNIKSHTNNLMRYIAKYIDDKNEVIFDFGPNKRLLFSDNDKDIIFKSIGMTEREVKAIIDKSPVIKKEWKISGSPFNVATTLLIRHFMLTKQKKEMEMVLIYLTLAFYSSAQFKFFPYEPNENIMRYTINNLSNKYYIKQYGNMYKTLKVTAEGSHENYEKGLAKGTDVDILHYLEGLKTRINNSVKNIALKFYEDWENGNYMNTEQDNYEEEGYYTTDNTSFAIQKIADSATMLTLTRGVDQKFITLAAKSCDVSVNAVRTAMNDIIQKKDKEIKTLFTLILQLYLMEGENTVRGVSSMHFITFCDALYIKSNTNDESILKVKKILDDWLKECSTQYQKTERAATLANYRKAIYRYCVFMLNQAAKQEV